MKASTVSKLAACGVLAAAVFPTFAADSESRKEAEPGSFIIDTTGLPPHLAQKVREKALQGMAPLVRYLHMNRMIYRVGLEEIVVPVARSRAAPEMPSTVVLAAPLNSTKPD